MVKLLKDKERPEGFDVTTLRPNNTDKQTAEELADFFGAISSHFPPLPKDNGLMNNDQDYEPLQFYQVVQRLKTSKKTRSTVHCDIPGELVTEYSDILAIPLTRIYNAIYESGRWPKMWKQERITVIPKCASPESFGQLRNLSCTPLLVRLLNILS